mmetsp:Transcript_12088/g.21945  ORF Transcript_12088/g.21945 Transcript_12088/m.21945 type:complete len:235 (+) Transcript_12088:617-1321(+)
MELPVLLAWMSERARLIYTTPAPLKFPSACSWILVAATLTPTIFTRTRSATMKLTLRPVTRPSSEFRWTGMVFTVNSRLSTRGPAIWTSVTVTLAPYRRAQRTEQLPAPFTITTCPTMPATPSLGRSVAMEIPPPPSIWQRARACTTAVDQAELRTPYTRPNILMERSSSFGVPASRFQCLKDATDMKILTVTVLTTTATVETPPATRPMVPAPEPESKSAFLLVLPVSPSELV